MRLFSFARRLSGVLVVAALAACESGGPTELEAIPVAFTLASVNGDDLPAALSSDPGVRYDLVSETITFLEDSKVTRTRVIRRTTLATGAQVSETSTVEAEYRVNGSRLEVGWFTPCPPNALCIGNDVGSYQESRLELESQLYFVANQPARLVYLRAVIIRRVKEARRPDR